MKILLVKNYAADQQYSMLAFADMLDRELTKAGCEVTIVAPPVVLGTKRNTVSGFGKWLGYVDKYVLPSLAFRVFEHRFRPDLVHVCDHSNAIYLSLFRSPTLLTCNDLLAIRAWRGEIPGQSKSWIGALQQQWIFSHIRRAPAIVCISDKTNQDLLRLAPEIESRASVIPMGLNYPYHPIDEAEADRRMDALSLRALNKTRLGETWMLHVGNDAWYKNRLGVVNIWKRARKQLTPEPGLVFVGPPPSEAMAVSLAGYESDVAFVQDASTEQLEALYRKASCLLFPSLAEGYGWPPLEAQACGCPVVSSDIEPLRNNCQGALLINPEQTDDAGDRVAELISDPPRIENMRRAGLSNAQRFTAEKMAKAYLDQYRLILGTA